MTRALPDGRRYFLDVAQSARGQGWIARLDARGEAQALAIHQATGLDELLARILAGRGISAEEALAHLDPKLRALMPDPSVLTDMDRAVERLASAVRNRERVAVFGDYDVDGAASAALFTRYLRHFGMEPKIHIPDRIFEGYGPNVAAMTDLARDATLIVTVDCGSNSPEPIAAAREAGADVIVLDHHQLQGPPPDCAGVVNPNRDDDLSGLGHLCAAGVTFMTLVALNRALKGSGEMTFDMMPLLDIVALATVADIVPLVGLNRAFVRTGLTVARTLANPGLSALAEAATINEPIKPYHFGFLIGPRINAGGRIGDASLGARLLATDDPGEAREIAATLDRLNRERQAVEAKVLEEAEADLAPEFSSDAPPRFAITASEHWHPGVVGIVAARLKEHHHRPAFAIALDASGKGTGSGRSISGVDLGKAVRLAVEEGLLEKGGGHPMAAGITVRKEKLGAFRAFLEERFSGSIAALEDARALKVDAALGAEATTLELMDMLEAVGPFGPGNPQPVFVWPHHSLDTIRAVGTNHLKLSLRSPSGKRIEAMAFRAAGTDLGTMLEHSLGSAIHVAGTLSRNHWQGRDSVEIRVSDAAVPAMR